jgi:2-polyprenyl-3-methyl-5-hydroxy-6-metoxy-1,4-benzoquinol methylase
MNSYFENQALNYLARSQAGIWRRFRASEFDAVVELMRPTPGQSLIDLGCGAGFYSIPLQKRFGLDVIGVDSSPKMLEVLSGKGVPTMLSSIESLDCKLTFDFGLLLGVLEFIAQPDAVFEKCQMLIRSKGKLILLVPRSGAVGFVYKSVHAFWKCSTFIRSTRDYIDLVTSYGFHLEGIKYCTPISAALAFRRR